MVDGCEVCGCLTQDHCRKPGSDDCPRVAARVPTLDDYFTSASRLAVLVRERLDGRRPVKRGEMRRAVEAFERIDRGTRGDDG